MPLKLEWHLGSYLRRGAPLAVALVNGQEPRLTSIVEGGRPWNGLFPIHIPLLVSNPWLPPPYGTGGPERPKHVLQYQRRKKPEEINKRLVADM